MLFSSISMAVIYYTCIKSVSEYSKSVRLIFKLIEVPYYGVLHYFTVQVTYVTLRIPLNVHDKVTNTTCLYLSGPFTSFYSGSFAEEVNQNINYQKPFSFIETSNVVNIILIESL